MTTDIGQDGQPEAHGGAQLASTAIFVDPRSRLIDEQLSRFAPSEASVLIVGETGTGKEVIARQLHARSGRPGPFIAVNCGTLSRGLGEAALFGHEAGAYTGAGAARAGWFEAAHTGTLFLDEIADVPPTLQVALLRVLQERQVVRLGSRTSIPVDVRIVAATNVDLRQAVGAGKFRLDLCFRLAVAILELPPLRERTDDIAPLAQRFVAMYSARLRMTAPVLSIGARLAMLDYCWPGNIRELENAIHAALLTCTDGVIRSSDLRFLPWAKHSAARTVAASPAPQSHRQSHHWQRRDDQGKPAKPGIDDLTPHVEQLLDSSDPQLLKTFEAIVIWRAMEYCKGNQVHAARVLGITRNVLRTYLKRFGLLGARSS